MQMQSLNPQTLIHIGVELVVVGGLSFWVHKKTSALQSEVDKLREIVTSQQQLLSQHDHILRRILGGEGPPPQRHPTHPPPPPQSAPPQRPPQFEEDPEPDESELDTILQEELGKEGGDVDESIEVNCEGDSCELKDPKIKKRRRKLKKKGGN